MEEWRPSSISTSIFLDYHKLATQTILTSLNTLDRQLANPWLGLESPDEELMATSVALTQQP